MNLQVIYGGSFNPPHLGHRHAAESLLRELHPDLLRILPDRFPPHKTLAPGSPSPEERLELCRLAFGDLPGVEIDDRELKRPGPSYTVDTLRELTQCFPESRFSLAMGSDMLLSFRRWHKWEEILSLASLVVLSREKEDFALLEKEAEGLVRDTGGKVQLLKADVWVLSSSRVREALARGEDAQKLLSPSVLEKIREAGYYREENL